MQKHPVSNKTKQKTKQIPHPPREKKTDVKILEKILGNQI
jgi:hypothetical protein